MTKTANYNLNQWDAGDAIRREDFNADNAALDAALAAKAEQSELEEVWSAAEAAQTKADAAYSTSNPAVTIFSMSTSSYAEGSTLYTFSKQPKFIILQGTYATGILRLGYSIKMCDYTSYNQEYEVTFQLYGKDLRMAARQNTSAFANLHVAVFW